jgi:hypothetical protein
MHQPIPTGSNKCLIAADSIQTNPGGGIVAINNVAKSVIDDRRS